MPGTAGDNLGLVRGYSVGESGWGLGGFNPNMDMLNVVVHLGVLSAALATPPGSPATGDCYIVAASPTGAWVGHATHVAVYRSGWVFYIPRLGWRAYNAALTDFQVFTGSAWLTEAAIEDARLIASTSYDDDAAAAAGGVPVGRRYRNYNIWQVRVS